MGKSLSLKEIMESTDDITRKLINEILKVEEKEGYLQELTPQKEKEVANQILKLIDQEIRK